MKKTIILPLFLFALFAIGQEGKVKRAATDFDNYAFMDAIDSYENLVNEGLSDEEIYKKLGNANYVNARYAEASRWYGKLMALKGDMADSEYIYRYAQTLKSIEDYDNSDKWMRKFEAATSGDERAQKFSEQMNYLDRIRANSDRYTLETLTINSKVSDFAPSFFGQSLVFSTARDKSIAARNIHKWNNGSFLNLHTAKFTEDGQLGTPEKFVKKLNTKTHESSSAFTKDGSTMYFTRNNSQNGQFSRDKKGISRLKLYKTILKDGTWQKAVELPFNSDDYSVAHPTLSDDEKTLYFSSDMPGTSGASDIFKVSINSDGSYGEPENLGSTINTEGRETFPFVKNDILYFASDGHPGLGGLDIFAAKLGSEQGIQNLGSPLNSSADDFSYIIDDTKKGYFASNRDGSQGDDDIYGFEENEPLPFTCISKVTGVVKDLENGKALANAKVIIMAEDSIVLETLSDNDGGFKMNYIPCSEASYSIIANKDGYLTHSEDIVIQSGKVAEVVLELPKKDYEKVVEGQDLMKVLNLEPIYFDYNKSYIRKDAAYILNQVVAYMNKYPDAKVSIESHTDSRGKDLYNTLLSERRAKSTRKYLIKKGIASERLTAIGYGESRLTNECGNGVTCSNAKHDKNRRSEFIVNY